jgi:hypothetical protein
MPTLASAGRLGTPFNVVTLKKLSNNFGSFVVDIYHYIAIHFDFL